MKQICIDENGKPYKRVVLEPGWAVVAISGTQRQPRILETGLPYEMARAWADRRDGADVVYIVPDPSPTAANFAAIPTTANSLSTPPRQSIPHRHITEPADRDHNSD